MTYQEKTETLKLILSELKTEVSEHPSFDELNKRNDSYLLIIAIENYLEYR